MKTILVVDDEPDILHLAAVRLKKNGYRVVLAATGAQALTLAAAEKPDLVLLDLLLPDISGDEVCRRLRQDETLCDVPVIIFSASCSTDGCSRARATGADDLIIKPFEAQELLTKIKGLLAGRRQQGGRHE